MEPIDMPEVLIKAENVSKKFCRGLKKSLWYGLQDIAGDVVGRDIESRPLRRDEFWAVKDVSFELRRGECLGLIGQNGAGKTTLLKMLNGLIKPDSGSITMRGRIGALIALGAGFNPILSGRENIYVNASVLGLSKKEIDMKVEEIIDFSGIREFIDAPVQNYSSGMQVRLGFAIATALEPDVLILDEVLAVGDASFRHKCYNRIGKLLERAAVILVSHSMDYITQTCSSVMMMRRGSSEWFADSNEGVAAYVRDNESSAFAEDGGKVVAVYPPIRSAEVRLAASTVQYGGTLVVEVEIECHEEIEDMILSFSAINRAQHSVMCWDNERERLKITLKEGRQLVRFSIEPLMLQPGRYAWCFHATRFRSIGYCIWMMRAGEFEVEGDFRTYGDTPYLPMVNDCEVVTMPSTLEAIEVQR